MVILNSFSFLFARKKHYLLWKEDSIKGGIIMFKKFYVVAIGEAMLPNAIRKLNEFNIESVHLYELAGENVGCWALGFKASKKHFMNFINAVRVERILLEGKRD